MRVDTRHWSAALAAAAALHFGVAVVLLQGATPPGAAASGAAGIEIALGPMGGASTESPTDPEIFETVESAPEETVDEAELDPPPDPVDVVEVEPVVPVDPVPLPRPRPRAAPKPKPVVQPEATVRPVEQRDPVPAPQQLETTRRGAMIDAGSTDTPAAGGNPGAAADYLTILRAWMERHREYPAQARRRGEQGIAHLYFAMDRAGRVLDARVVRSSGSTALDREVLAMIRRAEPLPPIPEDMPEGRLELVVPVAFHLR